VVPSDTYSVGPQQWVPWATLLISEIRSIRPNGLILVGGVNWAFDLRQVQVSAPNILYSAHIYPNRPSNIWNQALGRADELPVFVGEWGGHDGDIAFGTNLAQTMRNRGLGWTSWSWVDDPPLVKPPRAPLYEPTLFGNFVKNQLAC
jgi:Cellulase (glycosyl hydrolase family 5)